MTGIVHSHGVPPEKTARYYSGCKGKVPFESRQDARAQMRRMEESGLRKPPIKGAKLQGL